MPKINTAPLSGTRDFLPLEVLRRGYVIETVQRVYQRYGFEPLETPAMERLETLLGKYGEEGDQLVFRVLKRGAELGRALARDPEQDDLAEEGLRYDLTVPLARVVAQYRNELPRVFKRYQIQPVYRADRPAKARYREFYQCDLDIVGSSSQTVEAEVIGAGAAVLTELGFSGVEDFAIRLNHRGILRGLIERAKIPPSLEADALVAVDKLDKIGPDGVLHELAERGIDVVRAMFLLDSMTVREESNEKELDRLCELLRDSEVGRKGVDELRSVVQFASHGPAKDRLRVDPRLARGLSYYTGAIFEIEFPGLSGSGGGGGRYDDLIGMFSGQPIPACGFSLGLERIILVMEERGLFPDRLAGEPQALVTRFDDSTTLASLDLADRLRREGMRVDLYPDADRYGVQFKYADRRRIRYALLLSPREVEAGVVAVRDLQTGEQVDVAEDKIGSWLAQRV